MAYKEGYADRLFFVNYTLPKMQVGTPRTITPENFKKIQCLEIPEDRESLRLSCDLLLFSCIQEPHTLMLSLSRETTLSQTRKEICG